MISLLLFNNFYFQRYHTDELLYRYGPRISCQRKVLYTLGINTRACVSSRFGCLTTSV